LSWITGNLVGAFGQHGPSGPALRRRAYLLCSRDANRQPALFDS